MTILTFLRAPPKVKCGTPCTLLFPRKVNGNGRVRPNLHLTYGGGSTGWSSIYTHSTDELSKINKFGKLPTPLINVVECSSQRHSSYFFISFPNPLSDSRLEQYERSWKCNFHIFELKVCDKKQVQKFQNFFTRQTLTL